VQIVDHDQRVERRQVQIGVDVEMMSRVLKRNKAVAGEHGPRLELFHQAAIPPRARSVARRRCRLFARTAQSLSLHKCLSPDALEPRNNAHATTRTRSLAATSISLTRTRRENRTGHPFRQPP